MLYQFRNGDRCWYCLKFDYDINFIEKYRIYSRAGKLICDCPSYSFDCKHKQMFPKFELERAVDSGRFYDPEKNKWYDNHDL